MCVTLQSRFRNGLCSCRSLRDATLSRPINAFDKYLFGIVSFQVLCTESLRVMVRYKSSFFGVAVVLLRHTSNLTRTIYDPPTVG